MAKTFKPVLPTPAGQGEPKIERDFLDLLNELPVPVIAGQEPPAHALPGTIGNPENGVVPLTSSTPGKRSTGGNTGKPTLPGNAPPAPRARPAGTSHTPGNITTGEISSKAGVTGNIPASLLPGIPAAELARSVRQTFVLSCGYLERLRDHVHARRTGGNYAYSQKQALETALDWLFTQDPPVAPRPPQVRERERQQGNRIREGRLPPTPAKQLDESGSAQ